MKLCPEYSRRQEINKVKNVGETLRALQALDRKMARATGRLVRAVTEANGVVCRRIMAGQEPSENLSALRHIKG
jgi:hypothetical protein